MTFRPTLRRRRRRWQRDFALWHGLDRKDIAKAQVAA
jgi:hypothetical protein